MSIIHQDTNFERVVIVMNYFHGVQCDKKGNDENQWQKEQKKTDGHFFHSFLKLKIDKLSFTKIA